MLELKKGVILENTYEIMEEIGAGGGGVVFRAKHLRLQTDVVVKKIKDEVRGKVKSRQEADILKKLKHPYLPRVYDFIETMDGVYTVMDFIHGENLNEAVKRRGRFPEKQVRKWAEQLGEALDYLHSQKPAIIHSDIKPENIMLTRDGDVCLIDFNISLAMGGDMESAVGISAGYSPPEQYRDPALYERVKHSCTQRNSCSDTKRGQKGRAVPSSDDMTELLFNVDDSQTGVLSESGSDKTQLLFGTDDDRTEILPELCGDETMRLPGMVTSKARLLHSETTRKASGNYDSKYQRYIGRGIDARSDIYSLGITFYYMLTGIEPSADFDLQIPLTGTNVSVSEGFAGILEKMMEIDPTNRYQSGGEFLKAIRNCYKLDHRYIVMHRKEAGIRIAALGCLMAGTLLCVTGVYQVRREKNSKYYGLYQQAVEAMNQYDFEDAGELLDEAKEISRERIDAYEEEVHLLYLKGDYETCISIGENYINTKPFQMQAEEDEEQFGNICYVVGNAYFETGDYANAVKLFENALKYYDQNGLYFRDYAIAMAKLGRIENAEKALKDGISLGLGQDSTYMAQGEIAHVKGEYETAAKSLRQTIETTEDAQMKKRAVLLCVDVYQSMGGEALSEAVELLEHNADGQDMVMTERLAEAYVQVAAEDESMADVYYRKALDLFLSIYEQGYVTYQLQENIAIIYEQIGSFDEAEKTLFAMAESYPQRYEVYKRLAFLEADRQQEKENEDRDYTQVATYYEQAKELYSGKEQDQEMDMLDVMMQEIRDGGWM